jgi:hypothetical protein
LTSTAAPATARTQTRIDATRAIDNTAGLSRAYLRKDAWCNCYTRRSILCAG